MNKILRLRGIHKRCIHNGGGSPVEVREYRQGEEKME
jgi:hypothetical protein